jgi:hypothetical protein
MGISMMRMALIASCLVAILLGVQTTLSASASHKLVNEVAETKAKCDDRQESDPSGFATSTAPAVNATSNGFLTALATSQVQFGVILTAIIFGLMMGAANKYVAIDSTTMNVAFASLFLLAAVAFQGMRAPEYDHLTGLPIGFAARDAGEIGRGQVRPCESVWPSVHTEELQSLEIDLSSAWVRAGAAWLAVVGTAVAAIIVH